MKGFLILALAGLAAGVFMMRRRSKTETVQRLQQRAESVLEDLEGRVAELREQARRRSGEAKQKLQDQAHELETRQHELRRRLTDLSGDATRLLEKARSRRSAA